MDREYVEKLAQKLLDGQVPLEAFVSTLAPAHAADLGEVNLDLDRRQRCGFPEVVYGEGKTVDTMEKIFQKMLSEDVSVLATRISAEKAEQLAVRFPQAQYNAAGRTFRIPSGDQRDRKLTGRVAVVTAGTSDVPVAEEARETLQWMGVNVTMIHDVGVAGPHRLRAYLDRLVVCDAVVVMAGLEGALPSVVGGYVACPVVGVPTSIGYGASFGGVAALLGMLNSCASNVTVVNIDAGFKGGYIAGLIAKRAAR